MTDRREPIGRGRAAFWRHALMPLLASVLAFGGGVAFLDRVGLGAFYQAYMAPAVIYGCGHDYGSLAGAGTPAVAAADALAYERANAAIAEYLALRTQSFDCAVVPPSPRFGSLSVAQENWQYLQKAIGLIWRVLGVSWPALAVLGGLLYAFTAAAIYLLARHIVAPGWSMLAVALTLASPGFMYFLRDLRDYSKTPFLLAALAFGLFVIATRDRPSRLCAGAVFTGLLLGYGVGYRADVFLALGFVPLAFLIAVPWRQPARALRTLLPAFVLFVAAFTLVASPILESQSRNSIGPHVTSLGFSVPFDRALGVTRPPYSLGHTYNDDYMYAIMDDFERRVHGKPLPYVSPEGRKFVLEVVKTFPADILIRSYAALLRNIAWPFDFKQHIANFLARESIPSPFDLLSMSLVSKLWLEPVDWLVLVAAALLAGLCRSPREFLFLGLAAVFLMASTAMQFAPRHTFYTHFFRIFAVVWLAACSVPRVRAAVAARRLDVIWGGTAGLRRLAAAAAGVAGLLLLSQAALWGARWYQSAHLETYLARIRAAPVEDLGLRRVRVDGRETFVPESFPEGYAPSMEVHYLRLRFRAQECGEAFHAIVRNRASAAFFDHSMELHIRGSGAADAAPLEYYLSLVRGTEVTLQGIEIPQARDPENCLQDIARVDTRGLRLLPDFGAQGERHTVALYQRLADDFSSDYAYGGPDGRVEVGL